MSSNEDSDYSDDEEDRRVASSEEEDEEEDEEDEACAKCSRSKDEDSLLLCDGPGCSVAMHTYCCSPALTEPPDGDWLCPTCDNGASQVQEHAAGPSSAALGKRKVSIPEGPSSAALGKRKVSIPEAASAEEEDDEDEPQITGVTGDVALADFPHAREHCLAKPFAEAPELFCENCYCFVCDLPAAACAEWDSHCEAVHGSEEWQKQRQQRRELDSGSKVVDDSGSATSSGGGGSGDGDSGAPQEEPWSCEELLESATVVFPMELPEPEGLAPDITLRPYQRQSLAFMKDREMSVAKSLAGSGPLAPRGGWLCDEVGMGKTAVTISLILSSPCTAPRPTDQEYSEPRPAKYKTTLIVVPSTLIQQWEDEIRRFAPQLRLNVYFDAIASEPQRDYEYETVKVKPELQRDYAGNPCRDHAGNLVYKLGLTLDERREKGSGERLVIVDAVDARLSGIVKPNRVLVLINGELCDKGYDHAGELLRRSKETRKPVELTLRTQTKRAVAGGGAPPKKKKATATRRQDTNDLRDCDVLLCSAKRLSPSNFCKDQLAATHFHRLVVDESHLIGKAHMGESISLDYLCNVKAHHVWLLTGTPMSAGPEELELQAKVLQAGEWWRSLCNPRLSNRARSDLLRERMIRHTKAQRINGSAALALPKASFRVAWLDLSADEMSRYRSHLCMTSHLWVAGGGPQLAAAASSGRADPARYNTRLLLQRLEPTFEAQRLALCHKYTFRPDLAAAAKNSAHQTLTLSNSGEVLAGPRAMEGKRVVLHGFSSASVAPWNNGGWNGRHATVVRYQPDTSLYHVAVDGLAGQKALSSGHLKLPSGASLPSAALDPAQLPTLAATKYVWLEEELRALLGKEPDMRVAIFTHDDEVQRSLVQRLGAVSRGQLWAIDDISARIKPTERHRIVKDFQSCKNKGARLFVAVSPPVPFTGKPAARDPLRAPPLLTCLPTHVADVCALLAAVSGPSCVARPFAPPRLG